METGTSTSSPLSAADKTPSSPRKVAKKIKAYYVYTTLSVLVGIAALVLSRGKGPQEIQPHKGPLLSHLKEFMGAHRDRTLWGTYRPGLYFGMRMKHFPGLQTGLMWFDPTNPNALQHIRHQAQDRDGLGKFGWERHDGESFGRQELVDGTLQLTTSFKKRFCTNCRGGDWATRVTISKRTANSSQQVTDILEEGEQGETRGSLIFYIADENVEVSDSEKGGLALVMEQTGKRTVLARGRSQILGGWQLTASPATRKELPRIHYLGTRSPHTHNLSELAAARITSPSHPGSTGGRALGIRSNINLPDELEVNPSIALFQVTGGLPLAVDFVFTGSLTQPKAATGFAFTDLAVKAYKKLTGVALHARPAWPKPALPSETLEDRITALSGSRLTALLHEAEGSFDRKFDSKFGNMNSSEIPPGTHEAAKAALSNMLGGIGYFHGSSAVRIGGKVYQSWASALLTAVPSRSFFPRGFLWDEGFHQLLIQKWSRRLSREIIGHWLDLLNSQGWIAREQILGEEARSRVPAEFVVQDPTAANPPTLLLPLAEMARRLAATSTSSQPGDVEEAAFLRAAFPRIRAWVDWFVKTQSGKLPGSWRWRGRHSEYLSDPMTGALTSFTRELNPKTLTSGLDDYPRSSHPSDDERHVDLYCWMTLATKSIATIGSALNLPRNQVEPYRALAAQLSDLQHLNKMHFDQSSHQYRDWGNHTEAVRLDWRYIQLPEEWQGMRLPEGVRKRQYDLARFVDEPPKLQFVPHYGYISLFPLLMRLLPPASTELAYQLKHLKSQGILTRFGLRSLSTESSLHGKRNTEHDAPYWRGPIWININFLVLASLKHYAQAGGPNSVLAAELHDDLRLRLLELTVGNYQANGFLWENYDESSGVGGGCRAFTGWSALVVVMAGESYFDI